MKFSQYRQALFGLVVWFLLAAIFPQFAAAQVNTFEAFSDGEALVGQIDGAVYKNAVVFAAQQSLNEAEFPPSSGSKVVVDLGGPVTVGFEQPVYSFAARFTYLQRLTITAYDENDRQIDSAASGHSANLKISNKSGGGPNQRLEVSGFGIARLTIEADPNGSSFTMDDVVVNTVVPEFRVRPESFAFEYRRDKAAPGPEQFRVLSNVDDRFTLTSSAEWLLAEPSSGAVPQTVTVRVAPQQLPAGDYVGRIRLESARGLSARVSVLLTVKDQPELFSIPDEPVRFTQRLGEPAPQSQRRVIASRNDTVEVEVSTEAAWLTISALTSFTPAALRLAADGTGLEPGVYVDSIVVTAPDASNSPLRVPIQLTVLPNEGGQ